MRQSMARKSKEIPNSPARGMSPGGTRRVHEAVQVGECSTDRPFIPVQRICRRDFAEAGVLELRVLVDSDHGVTYRVGSRRRGTCLSSWGNTGRGSCWAD